MEGNILANLSIVAMVLRLFAIGVFIYVAKIQVRQFKNISELQPLKKLLLSFVGLLVLSNLPILYLHYVRIIGEVAPSSVTALATVTNALGTLLSAVVLLLIYKFAAKGDE